VICHRQGRWNSILLAVDIFRIFSALRERLDLIINFLGVKIDLSGLFAGFVSEISPKTFQQSLG
jgi:hypothetical protein